MDLFDLFATIRINLDDFDRGLNEASSKFKSFSNSLNSIGNGMKDVLSPAVKGFQAVEDVGKKAGNAITTGLKGFAAASTAVAGFGAAAVKSGAEFDATMSEVSAISGAAGQDFQDLRDKALEMGAKTKFSASEAAEAMTYMGMAGWKAGDMISGIEGIMNLAAASGEDLALTSDIVTDALTAFGKSAGDSGHLADIMAAASSNANTNVAMLGESFKYVAPVAGALGYSMEDTSLALGLMANAGIKASQSGTALRGALTNMVKPTDQMAAVMDRYGISMTDSNGKMYTLSEMMVQLREKMGGLDEATQASAAAALFGKEAMSGMLAIINAAPEDFEKLTGAIYNCNGAAEKMAATMIDNLQGDLTLLGSAFESLQIAISDSLTPTLREFAQFGQKAMAGLLEGFQGGGVSGFMSALSGIVTEGVSMLAEKAPEFASVSIQFIGALGEGFLGAAPQILEATNQVVGIIINGISTFLSEHSEEMAQFGIGIVSSIFGGFAQAGEIISTHIGTFVPLISEAFLSYHETLFSVGIDILGAIGQGIINNQDQLQGIASETITNMVTALRDNAPNIIEGGLALLEALVGAIEENMPLIIETGAVIIGKLVEGIATASPGVQAIIATAVLPHIFKIIEVVGNVGGAVSSVAGLVGDAISTIMGIGSKLMAGIKMLFGLIAANPVVAIITGIIATVVLLYTKCEWFRDAVHAVIDAVVGFFQWAWDMIVSVWNAAGDFFGGIVDGIKGVFEGIGEFLGGLFTAAWEMVRGAWDVAVGFFTEIGNGIQSVFEAVSSFLGEAFSAAWELISDIWSAAVDFFSGVWEGISGVFGSVVEFFDGIFSEAWNAITSVWDGVTEFFGGVWESITGVFSNVWDHFLSIGSDIVNGIKDGIAGAWGSFWSWLSGKVGGIVDGVKAMLGIHSPSTVFAGIGENMALGLAAGWEDQYSSIKRKIEGGMNFAPVSMGVTGSYTGAYGGQAQQPPLSRGGDTFNFYSPKALDPVSAAREIHKAKQRMALVYV